MEFPNYRTVQSGHITAVAIAITITASSHETTLSMAAPVKQAPWVAKAIPEGLVVG